MAIITEKDLDPVASGQIITPDMLDPQGPMMGNQPAIPPLTFQGQPMPSAMRYGGMSGMQLLQEPGAVGGFARGVVEQLPVAGMIAGGAMGGPPGAAAGAGLGAAIRNPIQQMAGIQERTPTENLMDIGKESAFGGITEGVAPYVAKGLQKIVSPFAKTLESRMAGDSSIKAAQELVEQGAPISPDVIMDTKTSQFFNWMAEKIWPASSFMANRRQSLQPLADGLKNDFVAGRGLYETSKGGVNTAWEDWVQKAGGAAAPYDMPKTLEVLSQTTDKPFAQMGAFWKKHASTFQNTLQGSGQATVQDIRDILNVLNPTAAKGAERTARMKIADAIIEDLGASGNQEMVAALTNARELARLQRIAGPLQSIFNKATIEPAKAGEEAIFNPASFVNQWNQRRGYFLNNKNYSAEDIRIIDAFADKMKALVPDLARAAKFNPPTSLTGVTQLNLENPLAVGGAIFKYPGLAVPVGLDYGLAHSLMSPNGIMRRFLTTGFNPPILSTKMGLMTGMEAVSD